MASSGSSPAFAAAILQTWLTLAVVPVARYGSDMPASRVEQLTAAQRECLRLVLTRHSSKEIAVRVGVSPSAVDKRIERAVQMLGVSNRFAAARALAEYEGDRRVSYVLDDGDLEGLVANVSDDGQEEGAESEDCGPATPRPGDLSSPYALASSHRAEVSRWSVLRLVGLAPEGDVGGDARNPLGRWKRLGLIAALMLTVALTTMALLNIGQTLSTLLAGHVRTGSGSGHRSSESVGTSAEGALRGI